MKIIPMPLAWADIWSLCTLDLDPAEGVRRFGAFHREETALEVWLAPKSIGPSGTRAGSKSCSSVTAPSRTAVSGSCRETSPNRSTIEHLDLTAAPVTWRADRVRAHETRIQTEPRRFEVWRLDDNGNEAIVDLLASEATANCVVGVYENRLDKQTYFVRRR